MLRRLLFVLVLFLLPVAQVQAAAQPRPNDKYGQAVSNIIASKIKSQGIAANDPKYSAALYRIADAANDAIYAAGTASTVAGTIGAVVGAPAWASLAVGLLAAGAVVGVYMWLGDDSASYVKADGSIASHTGAVVDNPASFNTDLENEILSLMAEPSGFLNYEYYSTLPGHKLDDSCMDRTGGYSQPRQDRQYKAYFNGNYNNADVNMCGGALDEVLIYAAAYFRGVLQFYRHECAKSDMEWACAGAVFPSTVEYTDISCSPRNPGNGFFYMDCYPMSLMAALENQWDTNQTSDFAQILDPRFTVEVLGVTQSNTNVNTVANKTKSGESYVEPAVVAETANALIAAVNPYLQQTYGFQISRIEIEDVRKEFKARPSTYPRYNDYYGKPARNIESGPNAGKPDYGRPLREPVDKPEVPPTPNPNPNPNPNPEPNPEPNPQPSPSIDTSTLAKEATLTAIKTKLEKLVDWFTGTSPEPTSPAEKSASDFTPVFNHTDVNKLKGWSMPAHLSECPKASFSVWNQNFTVDAHCNLMEQHRATISASMAAVWLVMALFVALSA
jgi:hypothetical protein